MIKRHIINKAEVAFWAALVLCSSYMLKVNLVLAVLLFSFWAYLKFTQKNLTRYTLLKLSLLFMIIFGLGYFFMYQGWPRWYLPVSAVAMLSAIIFNSLEISLLLSTASALALVVIFKNDFHLGALFLVSAILSSILVKGVRRRSAIIRAGFLIGAVQAATLLLIEGFRVYLPQRYSMLFLNGVISSVAAVGLLPIFEYLFDTVTNISLLELADLSSPLMQRMVIEAPGTYHHSLVVGNLSEAAAHSVGAHELLARVGSYYHDIGKLFKPDYFSENQNIEQSKHDNLTPTISKMVIMNHVKEGVELARKYKLNHRLIDFIEQHHGTSLVYFFYRRALENLEEGEEVKEEGFRYPGPKPNSRETAIVLLADSVEAAIRTLKEPDIRQIEDSVHKIINNKFIEGQLDECDLTLKDLEKISKVFIHILNGIYHTRITYPENTQGESSNPELKKEDPSKPPKDKKGGS